MINRFSSKNLSYFDPIGFGCLSRGERRTCEQYLVELHQKSVVEPEANERESDTAQSAPVIQQKSRQSNSATAEFLDSVGTMKKTSPSIVTTSTVDKLREEMAVYRSLAQREYQLIVDGDKEPNVVGTV